MTARRASKSALVFVVFVAFAAAAFLIGLFGVGRSDAQGVATPEAPVRPEPLDSIMLTLVAGEMTDAMPPGAMPGDGGPSAAVFPPQQLPFRFNHELHIKKLGLACLHCHAGAASSSRSRDNLIPRGSRCDGCHGTDHADTADVTSDGSDLSRCGLCHEYQTRDGVAQIARIVIPEPHLKFSHKAHFDRNIGCQQCHGHVEKIGLATREQLPRMRGCLRCHHMPGPARGDAKAECTTCHVTVRGDVRMQTRFPSGDLLPPAWLRDSAHDADWTERHKVVAAIDSSYCANCHSESECLDCHDGRVSPVRIHPNDWLHLHAVAGQQDNPRCSSCHHYQRFCVSCHTRSGITMTGPNDALAAQGRFHPPSAIWNVQHSRAAQRNLAACVSCHIERDCAICHASPSRGGAGDNPHGPGFTSRCGGALRKNPRPCQVCHTPDDRIFSLCR